MSDKNIIDQMTDAIDGEFDGLRAEIHRLRAENEKLRAALLVIENYARGSLNDSAALKETGE